MKKGMIAKCGGCMKRERDVFLEGWRFKREWRWHEMWCVQGGGFFILFILFYFILFIYVKSFFTNLSCVYSNHHMYKPL